MVECHNEAELHLDHVTTAVAPHGIRVVHQYNELSNEECALSAQGAQNTIIHQRTARCTPTKTPGCIVRRTAAGSNTCSNLSTKHRLSLRATSDALHRQLRAETQGSTAPSQAGGWGCCPALPTADHRIKGFRGPSSTQFPRRSRKHGYVYRFLFSGRSPERARLAHP